MKAIQGKYALKEILTRILELDVEGVYSYFTFEIAWPKNKIYLGGRQYHPGRMVCGSILLR